MTVAVRETMVKGTDEEWPMQKMESLGWHENKPFTAYIELFLCLIKHHRIKTYGRVVI
jgi:hypothetical protein